VIVSLHAISRWRERADDSSDDDAIIGRITHALLHSRPVRLRSRKERISKMLKHGNATTYHQSGQHVFVLTGSTVVSVYLYNRDRWQAAPPVQL
jgi:hypothetical protein